jgi:hypothetical protein
LNFQESLRSYLVRHGNNKYHKINMDNISSAMKNSMIQTTKLILERNKWLSYNIYIITRGCKVGNQIWENTKTNQSKILHRMVGQTAQELLFTCTSDPHTQITNP